MIETIVKKLRHRFLIVGSLLIVFMVVLAFVVASTDAGESEFISQSAQVLKSVQMLVTLFGIPAAFGLFVQRIKICSKLTTLSEQLTGYTKQAFIRLYFMTFLFVVNASVYLLLPDQSQLMLLTITTFVFLFIWPSVNRITQDLGIDLTTNTEDSDTE